MTTGAIVLMVLGNNPPSAGAFCLSAYYQLDSVDRVIRSQTAQTPNRWKSIEIFFSGTPGGNVRRLIGTRGQIAAADVKCHFVVCNGKGGEDGEIQATGEWQAQRSISRSWKGAEQNIRICLIGDGVAVPFTDYQLKRLQMLLEALCGKFHILADSVYLPSDCE